MEFRWVDEFGGGFGWLVDELRGRTGHALVVDGGVWLVDPVDVPGLHERVGAAGEPRGVIQLLDRHNRDAAELASGFGVPHVRVPLDARATPFSFVPVVDLPRWREVALWWGERRVLVVADALGTLAYFRAPGERLGVYPWLRVKPPVTLAAVRPERILCGHGEGVHEDAAAALQRALATSRRRLPGAAWNGLRFLAGRLTQS